MDDERTAAALKASRKLAGGGAEVVGVSLLPLSMR